MRRLLLPLLLACFSALAADAGRDTPLATLPYTPGLDPSFMDRTVDPCVDFYAYACGGWQRQNPIPPDQSNWGVYGKLQDQIQRHLWGLLQTASDPSSARSPVQAQIGDYFAACMDEARIDALGSRPLEPALAALAKVKDRHGLAAWLAEQHGAGTTDELLFAFGSQQDALDATQFIAAAWAGGLGLPDRADYLDQDPKSKELREKYREHVVRTLQLLGDDAATARKTRDLAMDIDTALAKATLTRVERRDPYKVFHRLQLAELEKLAPAFDWKTYLAGMGIPGTTTLNASQPGFLKAMSAELKRRPLADWKRYLRWHLVNSQAPYLSRPFVDEDFAFNHRVLQGTEALALRWKRCVRWVDRDLGEALGQVFVQKNFSPELKQKTLQMVQQIEREMEADIRTLDWMSPATKQ